MSSAFPPSSLTDRGHSLRSLFPPPAALPSLPITGEELMAFVNAKSEPEEGIVADEEDFEA